MALLLNEHCYHHREREAVVRCPACHRFFCRECVTEHDDRMLCSTCLSRITAAGADQSGRWINALALPMQWLAGFVMAWFIFYLIGQMLLAIPHTFHEGTIWQADWWRQP